MCFPGINCENARWQQVANIIYSTANIIRDDQASLAAVFKIPGTGLYANRCFSCCLDDSTVVWTDPPPSFSITGGCCVSLGVAERCGRVLNDM